MPSHDVDVKVPAHMIAHADVSIFVKSDGALLGELRISKGSLDWRPAKHQHSCKMLWEKFAALMEEHGRG